MAGGDPRGRRPIIAALVVAALCAVGVLLSFVGRNGPASPPEPEDQTSDPTTTSRDDGPVTAQAEATIGFSGDEDGAAAAAIAYATASQRWLYLTDEEIRAAVAEIATPVAGARLADDVVAEVSAARDQLGSSEGRVWWLVRPMAWRVEHHATEEARVSVWVVTVLSAAEVAAPQTEWMTVTMDLAWVDGEWGVDGVRDAPGPTPITGPRDQPWDAEPFDDALAGFTRIDGEPVS